ncbi:neurocan core protein-like isoform X7 [Branchiostoma floridae]|uniref:Neurocan core protein-like isoform X7 n=1 Tax=Branchiostoma floridae TaxID=7739 RepID=A0A9J7MYT5_BRAFL|nr:neurocan core protein-like isoform X7 [Branchiostoma floridae]
MPPRTRPACLPKLRGQQATERLPYQRCSSTTRRHLRQVNRMDHRWVCLTLFLALLAGMTRGQECQDPLGMESGSIPDDSITASSWFNDWVYDFYDDPATEYPAEFYSWDFGATWYARLNGDGWAPTYSRVGEWLQVDLGEMKNVKGTITLGSPDDNFYVTSYKLQYSTDETTWTTYADTDGSEKVFPGNTDRTTPVTNLLDNPIGTRYVRFLPQTWRDYPVLRVEILGCAAGDTVATTLAPTTTAALTTGRATSVATTLAPTSGGPTTDALTTARDVDECAEEADNCSPQATCSDTPDSFTCTCNPGYTGNGVTCTDVDECASNNGGCGQTCTNNAGSFVCSCGTGYILNADGLACDDVDECASNNGGCEGTCTNNVGSFDCACGAGLVLNADGLACDTCADLYPGLQPSHNFGIYQNQCFWAGNFRTPRLNYMAAKQACQAQGGTLAMIKDEATQTFLSNHLKTISGRRQRRFWIGLDDLNAEKAFLWNDGTPLGEYDLFRSSAPHRIRDCVTLYKTRRMARWDIKNCDFRYPYICQLGGNGSK